MKKITKLLAGIVALSVATASLLTVISCSKEKEAETVGFNGLFNYSAIGGISLLRAYTSEAVTEVETEKSSPITLLNGNSTAIGDDEKQQILNNLALARNMLNGEIVQSKTQASDRSDYKNYYSLSVTDITGETQTYEFYYNSTSVTDKEDLFEGESEERLEGIVIFNSNEYSVVGEKEVEENEEEISFLIKLDKDNYVSIKQESENGEKEYSYTVYKNGKEVFETSVEYEALKNGKIQLTFETEQNGEELEYNYEFYQKDNQNFVKVKYQKEGLTGTDNLLAVIQILTDSDGNVTYQFIDEGKNSQTSKVNAI